MHEAMRLECNNTLQLQEKEDSFFFFPGWLFSVAIRCSFSGFEEVNVGCVQVKESFFLLFALTAQKTKNKTPQNCRAFVQIWANSNRIPTGGEALWKTDIIPVHLLFVHHMFI